MQVKAIAEEPAGKSPERPPPILEVRKPHGIQVRRAGAPLVPDRTRVLIRPFNLTSEQRSVNICARVMALAEDEVQLLLDEVLAEFGERHLQIRELLKARFEKIQKFLLTNQKISEARRLLIAAYFTHEYALEAAALLTLPLFRIPINPAWCPVRCDSY